MKHYSYSIFSLVAVMAVSNALLGCSITHTLKSADIPQLQVGSPLKGVQPAIFAFKEFRDVRDDNEMIWDVGIHKYRLDQPAAIVVATAIRKELERNGHTCVMESSQSNSDFVVEGTVYKYFLTMDSGGLIAFVNGNVATKLKITSNHADKKEFVKNYEGKYLRSGFRFSFDEMLGISTQALLEMVKEMSTDPELVEFIQNNTKGASLN
jgi:uncharacterized lipoprotein YajG